MNFQARSFSARLIEYGFAGAVCLAIAKTFMFLDQFGYLPSPFFHQKNQTFMDWYDPAYWAHHSGIYSQARSFYPPISFDFLRLFSSSHCYYTSGMMGRGCDSLGSLTITIFLFLNFALTFLSLRRKAWNTALPRAVALTLGASMLYGWERGNLVLPCFLAFVLAYGDVIRPVWLQAFFAGVAANFKPYLLVVPFTQILRRDFASAGRFAAGCLAVYLVSFAILGAGSPLELARNAVAFLEAHGDDRYGIFQFTTTYDSLLSLLNSSAPLRQFLGLGWVTVLRIMLPALMAMGTVGAMVCLLSGLFRRDVLSPERMAALGFSLVFVFSSPGAYALIFMLFFVFLEPWRGAGSTLALTGAYLWCIPWDYNLAPVIHETSFSFLAGHPVGFELSLTLGELLRPGFVLMMQFGLVIASIPALADAFRGDDGRFRLIGNRLDGRRAGNPVMGGKSGHGRPA